MKIRINYVRRAVFDDVWGLSVNWDASLSGRFELLEDGTEIRARDTFVPDIKGRWAKHEEVLQAVGSAANAAIKGAREEVKRRALENKTLAEYEGTFYVEED